MSLCVSCEQVIVYVNETVHLSCQSIRDTSSSPLSLPNTEACECGWTLTLKHDSCTLFAVTSKRHLTTSRESHLPHDAPYLNSANLYALLDKSQLLDRCYFMWQEILSTVWLEVTELFEKPKVLWQSSAELLPQQTNTTWVNWESHNTAEPAESFWREGLQ